MKYVKQFWIILLFCALGEGLRVLLPLPIPASVYGLILLLAALLTGIMKLERVEETADFLVEIMPVMFIPAGVGLVNSRSVLKPILLPVAVITVVTIITVMGVTGTVAQKIIEKEEEK